jgi:AcrR family transcriptional regulator
MVSHASNSLPSGRPPLPKGFVDEVRRQRCATVIADLAHELGPSLVTTSRVTARARIAKATFYALFDGREAAFIYACACAHRVLLEALEAAAEVPGPWEERLKRTIGALFEATAENLSLAELCLVHSKSLLPERAKPYDGALIDALAGLLRDLLPEEPGERVLSFSELVARSPRRTNHDRLDALSPGWTSQSLGSCR